MLNPAFWLCVAALLALFWSFLRFRSDHSGCLRGRDAVGRLLSLPMVIGMSLVAVFLAAFSVYMSYAAPRDIMADIVSAKRVLRGEPAYPEEIADLIKTNLRNEPARWSLGRFLPELREKEEREGQTYLKYQPHPPLLVLLTVPLAAALDIHVTALIVNLISLAALAMIVVLIRRSFALEVPLGVGLALLAATVSWSPVLSLLRQSQSAFLVGLLIILAWFFLRRGWALAAGIPLGIATCLKLYPGLLLVYLLLRRRRALLSAVPAMIAFALLPMPWMGWHAYRDSIHTAQAAIELYGIQNHDISLLAMFRKNGVEMSTAALAAVGLASIASIAWLMGATRQPGSKASLDIEYSLFVVLTVLLSPISWDHYLVLLLLPLFVLGERAFRSEPNWAGMFGVVCLALTFAVPMDAYVLPEAVRRISTLLHVRIASVPTIAQVVLAVWIARLIWKTRPAISARSRPASGAVPATPAY